MMAPLGRVGAKWRVLAMVVVVSLVAAYPLINNGEAEAGNSRTEIAGDATVFNFVTGMSRYDLTEALSIARDNDLIVAHGPTFEDHIDTMKLANPDLQVLIYRKSVTAWSDEGDVFPDSWYLRDGSGNKLTSDPWGSYLMDPRSAGWRQHSVDDCLSNLDRYGYDGCYFDVLGTGVLSLMPAMPVTGPGQAEFTTQSFYNELLDYAEYVRANIPSSVSLMSNSLGGGRRYFHDDWPSAELGSIIGGAHSEIWLRGGKSPVDDFKSEKEWKWDLEMLADASGRGVPLLLTTKLWTTATSAQVEQWRQYSYATFLLGTDGSHTWAFTANKDVVDDPDHALYQMNLGAPSGSYTSSNGVYLRRFAQGIALVNPGTTTRTYDLGADFGDHHGTVHRTVTLEPQSGMVLNAMTITATDTQSPVEPAVVLPAVAGPACQGHAATIVGTVGDDVIRGTAGDDVIVALDGNDRITTFGGNDIICAGAGDDVISGGTGADLVIGGTGDDVIRGHSGTDTLNGGEGRDVLFGHSGYDFLTGGSDDDLVVGSAGLDHCAGNGGDDRGGSCESRSGIEAL